MIIVVIAGVVAGSAVLLGLLVRESLRITARFMFTPDMDEEWMVAAPSSALADRPCPDKSMIATAQAPAVDLHDRN